MAKDSEALKDEGPLLTKLDFFVKLEAADPELLINKFIKHLKLDTEIEQYIKSCRSINDEKRMTV